MSGRNLFMAVTFAFFLLLPVLKRRSFSQLASVYTAAIALIAYQVIPRPGFDLYNYWYGTMGAYENLPLSELLLELPGESEPLVRIYFFLISKLPYKGFLALINVLIVYALIFWLLKKISDRFPMSNNSFAVLVIWTVCVTPYYTVLGGIRYQLAFTIFAWALYNELVERRWGPQCWCVYVATVLIHNSAIVLLAIRVALILYSRYTGILVTASVFLACIAAMPLINFLSQILDSQLLQQILDKGGSYYESGGSDLSVGNWITALVMAVCGIAALLLEKKYGKLGAKNPLAEFQVLLLAFCLGSVTASDIFARFGTAIKFAALPLFAQVLSRMGSLAEEKPSGSAIRVVRNSAILERQSLELFLLIAAGLYLGYQYLGKLTLVVFEL